MALERGRDMTFPGPFCYWESNARLVSANHRPTCRQAGTFRQLGYGRGSEQLF